MTPQKQQELRAALAPLLREELITLRALDDSLQREHGALLDTDPMALEQATQQKVVAIDAHREQQARRLQWQEAQGLPDSPADDAIADLVDPEPELNALQRELTQLSHTCQEHNRRNGGLILRLQDRTRGALDVLRGGDDQGELYSLHGAREHQADGRSLGKA